MSDAIRLTDTQESAAHTRAADNLALRSGAGCGKTLVLAMRYAQLLTGSDEPASALSRLVAITFTEKAALEMLQRTRRQLLEAADAAQGPARQRLLEWVGQLSEARISTIHSFCASLLRGRAVEAGIDPAFAVCADPLMANAMIGEAAEQAALSAVEAEAEGAAGLLAAGSFESVVEHVRKLVTQRGRFDPADYLDADATLRRWNDSIAELRAAAWERLSSDLALKARVAELAGQHCQKAGDRLLPLRDALVEIAERILADPPAATSDDFARLTDVKPGNVGGHKAWGGKEAVVAVRHLMKEVQACLEDYGLFAESPGPPDAAAARSLAALAGLAAGAIERYTARKRSQGLLDFDDLLICAERLLAGSPAACEALSGQIDQLLVDECQDTDALQVRLLNRLARGAADVDAPLPPGRLFLVGDAMQSIYRFRGAQVEVFEGLCRRLGPEHNEDLDVSFRTHPAGVAFINHLFGPLLGGRSTPPERNPGCRTGQAYAPIRAHRPEVPDGPSVEILLGAGGKDDPISSADDASAAQAAVTAQRIREMLDAREKLVWDRDAKQWRAAEAGDIAVLFARMTPSLEYEHQLAAWDVPYCVVAGTGFFKQQEVYDVLNALRVIDNPFDDIALVGVLRSSLFGLDDGALVRITAACHPPYLPTLRTRNLADILTGPDLDALSAAVSCLTSLHAVKDAIGIDALIDRLLTVTGYEAALLCRGRGGRPLGNVRLLTERARTAAADGMALADFIAQCDMLVLSESRYEQAAAAGEGENVVRLMTIHKAKGLEFPVVFVPDLNAQPRGDSGRLLGRADVGLTYRPPSADEDEQEDEPLMFRIASQLEKADERAENVRKLYVAVTRHRDHLVFVGADWRSKEGAMIGSNSLLARMDEVLHILAAVDGKGQLAYGDGYSAVVRSIDPRPLRPHRGAATRGRRMLAEAKGPADLAAAIAGSAGGKKTPELLGPVPAETGRVEMAVTALADFACCPMLYRWRHELRVPGRVNDASNSPAVSTLDAATAGTLFHRCMELLDFAKPQAAELLVAQAVAELDVELGLEMEQVHRDLQDMLDRFAEQPLWGDIAGARSRFAELDFLLEAGPAVLRGQIDLLYEDGRGHWHIVDYKSDRVSADDVEAHASRYELQMQAYALAASKHLGGAAVDASLYFLRPGAACEVVGATGSADALRSEIHRAAGALLTARRSGTFEAAAGASCKHCPYNDLCNPTSA